MDKPTRRRPTSPPPLRELGPGAYVSSYLIADVIAVGGMATVYEAVHTILPRRVALKVMHGELLAQKGAIDRLFQEASITESLSHPGTVRLYEVGLLGDRRPWMAMELIDADTLTQRLALQSMSPAQVLALITELTDVLMYAHAGNIVHRDLKPDNVMVPREGGRSRLIDWGIARSPSAGQRLTLENATPGTPTYMAPEQARGHHVDGRCDVYALGVLAYEALVGAPPFVADNEMDVVVQHLTVAPPPIMDRRPDVPYELAVLIEKMLAKEVDRRPTAAEVHALTGTVAMTEDPPYEELVLADEIALARGGRVITPRAQCDEVSGEFMMAGRPG
jgi:serine/threonine protein kinase